MLIAKGNIMEQQHFGQQLKQLRKSNGMIQSELAPLLGMTRSNLSMIENDESVIRGKLIDNINDIFKVDMSYWFELPVAELNHKENALIRLTRRGEYLAAIQLIVNIFVNQEDE